MLTQILNSRKCLTGQWRASCNNRQAFLKGYPFLVMSFYSALSILECVSVSVSHHRAGRRKIDKTFANVLVGFLCGEEYKQEQKLQCAHNINSVRYYIPTVFCFCLLYKCI
jgi:hypothetical protein